MSETDSFIEEVSEEVRRDRLFVLMRKYGWIGILAIFLMVGGAAYNEWRKASQRAAAEDLGDRLLNALEQPDSPARAKALAELQGDNAGSKALIAMLVAAESMAADDAPAASAALSEIAADAELPKAYRDLATLKLVLLTEGDMAVDERRQKLTALAVAGAPFRMLAEEQLAMLDIDAGDTNGAILRLNDIISDVEVTAGLRNRASQLIVVLGGEIDGS